MSRIEDFLKNLPKEGGLKDKLYEAYAPGYWDAQDIMKNELQYNHPDLETKSGDAMRDSKWDRAQAFATALLFREMFPERSTEETKGVGRAYEYGSGIVNSLLHDKYSTEEKMLDAYRDVKNNEAAYDFYDKIKENVDGVTPELDWDQMIELGKLYATGRL